MPIININAGSQYESKVMSLIVRIFLLHPTDFELTLSYVTIMQVK